MLIGYARVSSNDRNLDLHIDEFTKAGCSKNFSDQILGINKKHPGPDDAVSHLRKKDTLVIYKLDRLGRNPKGLIDFAGQLENNGVYFKTSLTVLTPQHPQEGSFSIIPGRYRSLRHFWAYRYESCLKRK